MPDPTALEKFGAFMVIKLRDRAIENHLRLQAGQWKSPALQALQAEVVVLPPETKDLMLRVVVEAIDAAMHDLLFAFQEAHDRREGIVVSVDGSDIAEVSDGLQGEPYGPDGWVATFSAFPELGRRE